jgi:hypothetical protein
VPYDVPVEGGKNFDYLLGSSDSKGPGDEIVKDLRTELRARNVREYLILTPHREAHSTR